MNRHLDKLQPYPFSRIRSLLSDLNPADLPPISFAMGEPRHPAPAFVLDTLANSLSSIARYPATLGTDALRNTLCDWLSRRFGISRSALDANSNVLPVNGTREALFAIAQAVIDDSCDALVAYPNPFYQIYEGATLLAGGRPELLNCLEDNQYLPDFASVPADVWQRCQLLYICTPGNPTGSVMGLQSLMDLIRLADEHDFIIASDECYSEIYPDESNPPPGLLQACWQMGRTDFRRCLVFHSLSKRSNLPGLRSGFVAGDARVLSDFLLYRTYHGCAMPLPVQQASIAAWSDETHVRENRQLYRRKFAAVHDILAPVMDVKQPDASFYLWPKTPIDDLTFTRALFSDANIHVVPGSFLARDTPAGNPGQNRVRLALVAEVDECIEGARRIRRVVESL
ncbi:MAG: succinyldiaminopimelate transaminase [Porticoccaceae bacterium]|nr:succinyldiaminopimelate transaminase [Porticoccaceae bacterium]